MDTVHAQKELINGVTACKRNFKTPLSAMDCEKS